MIEPGEIIDFDNFFMPTLTHFKNGNGWKSSQGIMRYEVEAPKDGTMHVSVWYGPFCKELSEIDCENDFPFSEEGLECAEHWLRERCEMMETQPTRTLEECMAYRKKCLEEGREEK